MSRRKYDDRALTVGEREQLEHEVLAEDAFEDAEWWIVGEPQAWRGEGQFVPVQPLKKRGKGSRRLRRN